MTAALETAGADRAAHSRATAVARAKPEAQPDRALIVRIAAGDRAAMGALYARHHENIYRFAHRMVRSAQAAEDIAGDVFLDVWRGAGEFEHHCEVTTWLFAIARNKSIGVLRRNRTDPLDEEAMLLVEDDADGPETLLHKQDTLSALRTCLSHLSPAHRSAIDLVYFQDKSILEAAEMSGTGRGTIKTRLFYARERLAEMLSGQGIAAAA
jgi:RNA polymerase sigma-70 factor (ECF subfamily)